MKSYILSLFMAVSTLCAGSDWHTLFDGSSLEGWKSNEENPGVFKVLDDGSLEVNGGRAHLFWIGTDEIPGEFKNFEWQAEVKTTLNANSGIFFHTKYQDEGWPSWGVEAQVNTTHKDFRKTGSIWGKKDVENDAPSVDDQWFVYNIKVVGKTVTVSVDGKVVNEYVEPENPEVTKKRAHWKLGAGTFAIQGHDPKSIVYYKNIKVRAL